MTFDISSRALAAPKTSTISTSWMRLPVLPLEPMTKTPDDGWKLHEAEQRLAWLKLTPAQRLAWLEDAKHFAEAVKRARKVTHEGRRPV
jgi:hypothetical protein